MASTRLNPGIWIASISVKVIPCSGGPASPDEIASRPERARDGCRPAAGGAGRFEPRPEGELQADGRRRLLAPDRAGPGRGTRRSRRPGGAGGHSRGRRARRGGRRGGAEPVAARGPARRAPAGRARELHAAARERAARARAPGAAAPARQRERLLLPLARGLLQPRRRHRRAAAAAGRPHGAALLRRVRAVLPGLLDLVHRLAHALRLAAVLDRLARGAVPAGRVPALLPRLPRAAAEHAARLGGAGALPAGARGERRRRDEPRAARGRRGRRRTLGDRRDDRPREAALLRRLLHARLRGARRLVPPHARPGAAPPGQVAALGHRRRRLPVPRLLRAAVRARKGRARARARRLRAARAHPALARLRRRQAPADGRRAAVPARARVRARRGRDRGPRALHGGRDGRALGGAARHADRAHQRGRRGAGVLARQGADPGRARPALLPGALPLAQDAGAALGGPERRPRPRADGGAAAPGHRRGARPARDGAALARPRRRPRAVPQPRRAAHRRRPPRDRRRHAAHRQAQGRPARGRRPGLERRHPAAGRQASRGCSRAASRAR